MIEEHLRAYLLADAAILAALGGDSPRVYYGLAPEGAQTYPYLVLSMVSTPRLSSLKGPSGLANPRVQATVVHSDPVDAADLAALVRARIDGATSRAYPLTVGTATVQSMHVEDEGAGVSESPDSADFREFWHRFDVRIWHTE